MAEKIGKMSEVVLLAAISKKAKAFMEFEPLKKTVGVALMNQEYLLSQFDALLPLAAAWATKQQQAILRDGVSLSEKKIADVCAIGFKELDRVRLLQVETIPRPSQPQLRAACDAIDFLTPATRELTLGYGI